MSIHFLLNCITLNFHSIHNIRTETVTLNFYSQIQTHFHSAQIRAQVQRSSVFFSQLKLVITDLGTALSSSSINTVLRIKLRVTSITEFREKFSDDIVDYRYSQKDRRIHHSKQKQYQKRTSTKGLACHLT